MKLIVDASVVLRWYIDAPGSDAAAKILEADEPLIAPDLVVAEVGNAVWKLVRSGEISLDQGRRIVGAAPTAFSALVGGSRLVNHALSAARELDHPFYDCFYVVLAEMEKGRLVTADEKLIRKLEGTRWAPLLRPLRPD